MHRLLRSIGIIGLLCVIGFSPEVADATTPTTIIRTEKSTAQISQGQKIQQNVRLRRNSRRIPSIEARLQQKRPSPEYREFRNAKGEPSFRRRLLSNELWSAEPSACRKLLLYGHQMKSTH